MDELLMKAMAEGTTVAAQVDLTAVVSALEAIEGNLWYIGCGVTVIALVLALRGRR